jgi:hypothetical protein
MEFFVFLKIISYFCKKNLDSMEILLLYSYLATFANMGAYREPVSKLKV